MKFVNIEMWVLEILKKLGENFFDFFFFLGETIGFLLL